MANEEDNEEELKVRKFEFGDAYEGNTVIKVWCDGREYDASFESYRPRYSYSIVTPKWQYEDNDIHGACNETPNLDSASQSLFAFLYACQEGMPQKTDGENSDLFPPQVRDWAYHYNDELSRLSMELEVKGGEK